MTKQEYITAIGLLPTTFTVAELIPNFPTDNVDNNTGIIAEFIVCKQAIMELGCERVGDLSSTIGLSVNKPWINSFSSATYSKIE